MPATHDNAGIAAWRFKLAAEIHSYEDYLAFLGGGDENGHALIGERDLGPNMTARVQAIFHHNPHTERDEVDVTIDASTQNYGGSGRIHLAHRVDIDALFNASAAQDHRTMVQLKKASDAIQKANEYAIAFSKSKRSKRR